VLFFNADIHGIFVALTYVLPFRMIVPTVPVVGCNKSHSDCTDVCISCHPLGHISF